MKKYREGDFGVCPRALCNGQPVVPVCVKLYRVSWNALSNNTNCMQQAGLHDEWKKSDMKVYCPKCRDLYTPASEYTNPPSKHS